MSYFACMSHVIIKFLFFVSIILLTFIYVVIHIHIWHLKKSYKKAENFDI